MFPRPADPINARRLDRCCSDPLWRQAVPDIDFRPIEVRRSNSLSSAGKKEACGAFFMAQNSSTVAVPQVIEFSPTVGKAPSVCWVRGPWWDAFWMQSALWLAPIALYLSHGYSDPEASPLDQLYFGLTALFWIGHRLCSTWMAYCTEAYRPLLRAQPVRFIVLPLLITALCFVIFLPADSALPWTRAERLVALAIIDYAWVTWHFAAQHFGALSVYRLRAGRVTSV